MLTISVYDWDIAGRNELIGIAVVPMTGMLAAGFVQVTSHPSTVSILVPEFIQRYLLSNLQVNLALEEMDAESGTRRWNQYGSVQGYIKARSYPIYSQVDHSTKDLPGHQKLV